MSFSTAETDSDRLPEVPRQPVAVSSDDLLPPVEPPSAGYLVQMFVVPGIIVTAFVLGWMLLDTVVFQRNGPDELIKGLSGHNATRWQTAQQLSDVLRSSGATHEAFKRNENAAIQLSEILRRAVDSGPPTGDEAEQEVSFRFFLCRALGHFQIATPVETLLDVAGTRRNQNERAVCRAAIQALATLAENLNGIEPGWAGGQPQLNQALLEFSRDEDETVRSDTTFALGAMGTEAAIVRLREMADDPYPEARYNAASQLAIRGDPAGLDAIIEMLDYREGVAIRTDPDAAGFLPEEYRYGKRGRLIVNGLQAARALRDQHADLDLTEVTAVLQKLLDAPADDLEAHYVDLQLRMQIRMTLDHLR